MSQKTLEEIRNRFFTSAPQLARAEVEGFPDFEVIGLSQGARARLIKKCSTILRDDDGEIEQVIDQSMMQTALLLECVVIKGTNTRVFSEADVDAIEEMSGGYLDPLIVKASALSALKADALKVAEGNSEATEASTSSSPSLAS